MRKDEFFRQLEYLLMDVAEEERGEAIGFYWDYLYEAGPEREEDVLREFGSPERIASIIRSELNGNLEDGGSFTEKGYEDERFRDPNYQLVKRLDLPEKCETHEEYRRTEYQQKRNGASNEENLKQKPRTSRTLKAVLFIILLVVASPFLFGAGGALVGITVAVIVTLIALLITAAIATIALLSSGVLAFGIGLVTIWSQPIKGILSVGGGLVAFGIGLLALVFSMWFYGKLIPRVFRSIGSILKNLSARIRRRSL